MQRWWWKIRGALRGILFPLICIQFIRTLILPNPLDVFLLFVLFILFLAVIFAIF